MSEERDASIPYCETCKHWDASRKKTWGVCTRHKFATDPDEACREWQAKEGVELPIPERDKRRSLKAIIGHSDVLFREVLPGDCDPDVVREVADDMRRFVETGIGPGKLGIQVWIDRLEGK